MGIIDAAKDFLFGGGNNGETNPLMTVKAALTQFVSGTDQFVGNFLNNTYPAVAQPLGNILWYLILIYAGWSFYKYFKEGVDILDVTKKLAFMSFAMWFFSWGNGAHLLWEWMYGSMEDLGIAIMGGTKTGSDTTTVAGAFADKIGAILMEAGKAEFTQLAIHMNAFFLLVATIVMLSMIVVSLTIAKLGMAVTMLFLPLSICFLILPALRHYFFSWLNTMLSFTYTYLLTVALVSFYFSTFGTYVESKALVNLGTITAKYIDFQLLELYCAIAILMLSHVSQWASSLTGATVDTSQIAMRIVRDGISKAAKKFDKEGA